MVMACITLSVTPAYICQNIIIIISFALGQQEKLANAEKAFESTMAAQHVRLNMYSNIQCLTYVGN